MKATLPDPISATTSPFAAFTFAVRFPHIINQIKTNNQLSSVQESGLTSLITEIRDGVVPAQKELFDPEDWIFWQDFFAKHVGKRYMELPFFEAEAYIYYRIIKLLDYRRSGMDPFGKLKSDGLRDHQDFVEAFAGKHMQQPAVFNEAYFIDLLYASLWANSADLSQLETNDALINPSLRKNLVIDDSSRLYTLLSSASTKEIDFIADNAGLELVSDFFLIDYLLTTGQVSRINLHLKEYPTFVSDATIPDIWGHLEILRSFQADPVGRFTNRLESYLQSGQLTLCSHPFWNSPCHFTELPAVIKDGFDNHSIVIFKGDANYRRLFEDRQWPFTTPLDKLLHYLGRPCFSIRTLKSEIVVGLTEDQVNALYHEDKDWLTSGRFGLIMGQSSLRVPAG